MGDALGAVFGGGQEQTQETKLDPATQELNRLKLSQLSSLFGVEPISSFGRAQPHAYTPTAATDQLLQQSMQQPNLDLMDFNDYLNMGLDEMSNYISQVATPQIMQQATLQGLEGGGFVPEAIAKATAQVGLPFVQSLPQASIGLGMAPYQAGALQGQRAQMLAPLADWSRSLGEQDLLRRQGLVTTGLTGIPYTPAPTVSTDQSQQPLFNFFGQG